MTSSPWKLQWQTYGKSPTNLIVTLNDADSGGFVKILVNDIVGAASGETAVHGLSGRYYLEVFGPPSSLAGWKLSVWALVP